MIMNIIFFIFLAFSGLLIILLIRDIILNRKPRSIPENFDELSRHQAAVAAMNLLEKGFFLKHILRNKGMPRDDRKHTKEYETFLNETIINTIKSL